MDLRAIIGIGLMMISYHCDGALMLRYNPFMCIMRGKSLVVFL